MLKSQTLHINGVTKTLPDIDPTCALLSVLRDHLELTGAHYGCGEGQCGACTVLIDGRPVRSCLTPVGAVEPTAKITTIEGLEHNGKLHPVQEAFIEEDALQCGYCTSGMILTAVSILQRNPRPSEQDVQRAMQGNVCRCGTYRRILRAVLSASRTSAGGSRK